MVLATNLSSWLAAAREADILLQDLLSFPPLPTHYNPIDNMLDICIGSSSEKGERKKECVEFTTHASSSIPHLHNTEHPSKSMCFVIGVMSALRARVSLALQRAAAVLLYGLET